MELHTIVENHNRKQIAPRFELCSVCAPILARGPEGLQLFRTPVVQEPQTGERRRGARLRAAAVPARLNSTRTSSAQPVQTHSKGTRRGCAQPPLETTARNAAGPKRIATQPLEHSFRINAHSGTAQHETFGTGHRRARLPPSSMIAVDQVSQKLWRAVLFCPLSPLLLRYAPEDRHPRLRRRISTT